MWVLFCFGVVWRCSQWAPTWSGVEWYGLTGLWSGVEWSAWPVPGLGLENTYQHEQNTYQHEENTYQHEENTYQQAFGARDAEKMQKNTGRGSPGEPQTKVFFSGTIE